MMTKAFLRKEFLAKRMLLSEAEQQQKIKKIATRFTNIQLHKAAFVLSYMALAAKKEINPTAIEKAIITNYPECHLCYPKIKAAGSEMDAIKFVEGNSTSNNQWGIPEIINGNIISPEQIDIILVPLLCFDSKGYRVGYGKGFYDRYIARCRPDVLTIGLSFFEPINAIEDVDEYDVPLQFCVTPEKLYHFQYNIN